MEEIRQAREDLQLVIDNVRAVIYFKDDENRILRLNRPAAEAMGMTVEEATGADTYELFPEVAAKYHKDDLKVIESGEPLLDIVEEFKPRDGKHLWIRTDKIPYIDPDTGVRRILAIAMDITALKDQEARLSDLNSELESKNTRLVSANDSLQQFAHVASHDLQEPLRKLMQFTEYLEQDCGDELSKDGRYFVDVISKSANRMRQLVRDILLLSSASGKELASDVIDLAQTMQTVQGDLEARIRETGANIEVGDLPVIRCDSTLVDQLFRNLVSNALKYQHKGATPHVRIGMRRCEDGDIEIAIVDNGIGMKPENTARIFDPFTRLHDRREYPGTGIGLAICRTVCERHDWSIRAESAPDEGTTFFLCIPAEQVEDKRD
jgi:PAS domain S-box-containing protein